MLTGKTYTDVRCRILY